MQIRDNVRERRRERIEQLIGQHAMEEAKKRSESSVEDAYRSERAYQTANDSSEPPSLNDVPSSTHPKSESSRFDVNPKPPIRESSAGADPELWWREREKRLKSGQAAGWQGLKGIAPASSARIDPPPHSFEWNKLIRGFSLRLVFSIMAFAGLWGWFKLELPGSKEAHD